MNQKQSFSKTLLIQESILLWVVTIAFLVLAFICVGNGYMGSLPWLASMVGFPWTAYGVSQACYYHKSKAENTMGGIVYETAMGLEESQNNVENFFDDDTSISAIDPGI